MDMDIDFDEPGAVSVTATDDQTGDVYTISLSITAACSLGTKLETEVARWTAAKGIDPDMAIRLVEARLREGAH